MRIDIWSDVVCPWCYIGKRRLENALADFEHADDVEVVYHSFQLDPGAPRQTDETVAEHLGAKYGGGPAAGQQMIDRVEAVAAEEGLLFRLGQARRGNTLDAHRLLHLALAEGGPQMQGQLKEALLAAHFLEGASPADPDVLHGAATGAGLDPDRVADVLAGIEFADAVEDDVRAAARLGATGVPFFVIDHKYRVSGAQPAAAFGQVLHRAWEEGHPLLETIGDSEAEACGPEGCRV